MTRFGRLQAAYLGSPESIGLGAAGWSVEDETEVISMPYYGVGFACLHPRRAGPSQTRRCTLQITTSDNRRDLFGQHVVKKPITGNDNGVTWRKPDRRPNLDAEIATAHDIGHDVALGVGQRLHLVDKTGFDRVSGR